ncbi:hypothetical protein Hanom_Chr00s087914g01797441 [Helianthus anomalus]
MPTFMEKMIMDCGEIGRQPICHQPRILAAYASTERLHTPPTFSPIPPFRLKQSQLPFHSRQHPIPAYLGSKLDV